MFECDRTSILSTKRIERNKTFTTQVKQLIMSDFTRMLSFQQIADRYSLSKMRIMQFFDELVKHVTRLHFPKTMYMDEIRFNECLDQKIACVLYDLTKEK